MQGMRWDLGLDSFAQLPGGGEGGLLSSFYICTSGCRGLAPPRPYLQACTQARLLMERKREVMETGYMGVSSPVLVFVFCACSHVSFGFPLFLSFVFVQLFGAFSLKSQWERL